MDITTLEAKFHSKIPYDHSTEGYKLYETLIPVLGEPRQLLVITDIEQDRDDLLAGLLLSYMHHLGIVKLDGFIANHHPSEKHAKFLRTVLHLQGIPEVPVAASIDGTGGSENRDLFWYELRNKTFEHQDWNKNENKHLCGYDLTHELVNQANERKLAVLYISSLQDIAEYFNAQDDRILQKRFANFVSQGGYEVHRGSIKPDLKAMNKKFHPEAAKCFTDRPAVYRLILLL